MEGRTVHRPENLITFWGKKKANLFAGKYRLEGAVIRSQKKDRREGERTEIKGRKRGREGREEGRKGRREGEEKEKREIKMIEVRSPPYEFSLWL